MVFYFCFLAVYSLSTCILHCINIVIKFTSSTLIECLLSLRLKTQGPEGHHQGQDQGQGQCPPSEPFSVPDSSLGMDQKPMYNQGYPGPPVPPSAGMQPGYGGSTMQGQSPGGFNPIMNQMGQTGGFSGMANMNNPRANMMRPRMMTATKPLRLQLQQRLQGQQVTAHSQTVMFK